MMHLDLAGARGSAGGTKLSGADRGAPESLWWGSYDPLEASSRIDAGFRGCLLALVRERWSGTERSGADRGGIESLRQVSPSVAGAVFVHPVEAPSRTSGSFCRLLASPRVKGGTERSGSRVVAIPSRW